MIINIKIIFFMLCTFLYADMFPDDGSEFRYTQIFFRWSQIPDASGYSLTIHNITNDVEYNYYCLENSILITDAINWNTSYYWSVNALDANDDIFFNSDIYNFTISPLPDYFPDEINVLIYNESGYQPGVTLMDFESLNFSGGLDNNGNPIWFVDRENFSYRFVFTQFLKNGNVTGFGPGKGYEIDLSGNIIFETPDRYSVHHDFNKTSRNSYFLISATIEDQYCPEECNPTLPDEIPWQGDIFRELDKSGNEIWSWNTFDYFDLTEYNPYYVETYTGVNEMDWTHSNSVFFDDNSQSVFVSVRNLSRITKINYSNKNLIWNMGETDFMNEIYFDEDLGFSQQHSVQVLENGNILFFDNHRYQNPELSRCLELIYNESDDYSVEIVWEHVLPAELFSGSRGECDRLENGNTLITVGRTGNTLEVTPQNEVVWQLEVKNMGVDVTKYRSARIPNLHPIAFSLSIDNYIGDIDNSYVEPINNIITVNIHNHGWSDGWFIYSLKDISNEEITTDSVFVYPFEDSEFNLDINSIGSENLPITVNLELYPSNAPDKIQTIEFSISESMGDLNIDGDINILDVVILVNLILEGDGSNPAADLNQDGSQNILDIVTLVNLILAI